jgi:hypothetical protein
VRSLPTAVAWYVEAAGGVPRPYDSVEAFRRHLHEDLGEMDDEQLESERVMTSLAKAALIRNGLGGSDEAGWFRGRLAAIIREVTRRQRRSARR